MGRNLYASWAWRWRSAGRITSSITSLHLQSAVGLRGERAMCLGSNPNPGRGGEAHGRGELLWVAGRTRPDLSLTTIRRVDVYTDASELKKHIRSGGFRRRHPSALADDLTAVREPKLSLWPRWRDSLPAGRRRRWYKRWRRRRRR